MSGVKRRSKYRKNVTDNVLNNFPDNIQTLCKVCHSYKSHLYNDFKKNKARLLEETARKL